MKRFSILAPLPDERDDALALVDVRGMSQQDDADRAGLPLSGAESRVLSTPPLHQ